MALIFPGDRLLTKMDTEAVNDLGQELLGAAQDLEAELAPTFRQIAVWWKWYEAVPRTKDKTFPFVGASNVVVPLIGITCDALTSRSLAQATAASPTYWSARSENEAMQKTASNMARYINWQADGNEFSIKHVLADMLLETYVTGRGACAINYRYETRPFFSGRTPVGMRTKLNRVPLTVHQGPLVEHVPREHLLWDTRYRIGDAPMVVRRHELSWVQLRERAKADEAWSRAAVESIREHPGGNEGEASNITATKDELDLRSRDPLDHGLHEILEIWVDWSMLGSRFEVPGEEAWGGEQIGLLAHVHRNTGKVLRLVGNPYLLPYKPFVDFKFRGGRGVAKRLEMLQSIQTTLWNQSIDARTRANAVWAITRNARHLRTPLDPSRPIFVDDMEELAPFTLPSRTGEDMPLMIAAQTMAERWMGHSDPLLGRETRSGGHPAPATSTLALLEQVNVMSAGTDVILQEEMSRIGEAVAMLNQQFERPDDGRLARILGPEDAAAVGTYLFPDDPIPGNYYFDVVALSRTENPDAAMRRTLMTAQAYQNYGALVAQGAMILDNPQAPPRMKAVWAKIMDSMGLLMERFLEASNVDETERFLVQLEQVGVDARNAFRQFASESSQAAVAARGGAAAGGAGVGGAPGPVGGAGNGLSRGAGGSFAGGGLLQ